MYSKLSKIAGVSLLTFAAFTGNAYASNKCTIGLAVANLQADFFNQIKLSAQDEGKVVGCKIITVDARGDSATQVNQIQDLITRQVNAIIYIPAGATAASVPVKAAKAAGIPVVTVDRNPAGAPGDTFIATDSVAAARALGNYVAKLTHDKANIGIIQGQIGTTPQIERSKGFMEAINHYPQMKVVERQASNQWAQDEGFKIGQDMLQRNPTINVIFGQADALALGAAQAAKVAGEKLIIVGFDGDYAGLQAVENGVLAATMTQQTQRMGRLAVTSAVKLIKGEPVPKEQLLKGTLTTKANVKKFIANHP
ncbi:substrate-binding domain-containing protein [Marinomonas spartinae]|uniref:substrate-binding domain-containing protein n=1 Tax=Marinomonas spartinae TaxID=1792290 RepID=UPI0018F1236E|nr:substrate-binding domain-containing protein [Marinomonas spartinae]MBJ7556919.1 substrate-binding domain-containing protein [Marinomonas spartinae]